MGTQPGSFLQWNGGRSTMNGGHLFAFSIVRLHRGPAIVCRRTKTIRGQSLWSDKKSDTSDMTPTGGDVYLSFFRPRSLESFLKGISRVLSSSYTFKDHLATDPFTRDFNLASDSHRTTVLQWWWNDEQLKESCSLASQEVTHLSKNNSQSDARR